MPLNLPATVQTLTLGLALQRCRRYPAFLISLAAALPFTWIGPEHFFPRENWERFIWLPCALVLIPAQAVAALEACLRFGERYQLASRISAALTSFGVSAAIAFWVWPQSASTVGQVVIVARYQRVNCFMFLALAAAFYATTQWRGLIARQDGAHLILMTLWAFTWMVPIIRPIPSTWKAWADCTWMMTARTWLLLAWVGLVAMRRPCTATLREPRP